MLGSSILDRVGYSMVSRDEEGPPGGIELDSAFDSEEFDWSFARCWLEPTSS